MEFLTLAGRSVAFWKSQPSYPFESHPEKWGEIRGNREKSNKGEPF